MIKRSLSTGIHVQKNCIFFCKSLVRLGCFISSIKLLFGPAENLSLDLLPSEPWHSSFEAWEQTDLVVDKIGSGPKGCAWVVNGGKTSIMHLETTLSELQECKNVSWADVEKWKFPLEYGQTITYLWLSLYLISKCVFCDGAVIR